MTEAVPAPDESAATSAPADASGSPASKTDATESAASAAVSSGETDALEDLSALSKEERRRYAEHLKLLDPAARKTFNTILTRNSQAFAEERKKLGPWAEIAASFERDPEGTLKQIQERLPKPPGPAKVDPEVLRAIEGQLDDKSKPLAPVVAPIVTALLDTNLAPVRAYIQQQQEQAKAAEAQSALAEFEKAHPDWKTYEDKMVEVGAKIQPGSMSTREFLDALYTLASADARISKATNERVDSVLEKVTRAAMNAEPDGTSVSPASSVRKATKALSAEEAFALAKQGIEVEL